VTAEGSATIRQATLDDVPEIRSIFVEHGNDGPVEGADVVGPYLRHLIEAGRSLVVDDGPGLAAFGATLLTGRGRHLTDLFVRRDRLGQGIGRPLLDAVFGDDWPRTTFASDDPRAMPLYIRAGMAPLTTCLYLDGPAARIPAMGAGLTTADADASTIADLEREWTGLDRSVDHAFWATQAQPDSFVILEAGEPVAAGHARARQKSASRAVDRLVIRPEVDPVGPVCAALTRAARGGTVMATFLGPNRAVRPLLEAGFRIEDRDTFMASEPDLVDPDRLLPNPGML
jgi:GNAT superfamily N-acetyltransferase